MSTGRVADKVCIVNGAAQGIGEAIGRGLVKEGACVTFADLNVEKAEAVAADIRKGGGRAIAFKVDVSKRGQMKSLIQRTVDELGQINVMFNNAGVNKPQNFLETTEDNWDSLVCVRTYELVTTSRSRRDRMAFPPSPAATATCGGTVSSVSIFTAIIHRPKTSNQRPGN